MDRAGSSTAMLATSCQTAWHHSLEENLHSHCCENFKDHKPPVTYYDDEGIQTYQKKKNESSCHNAEGLKYKTAQQGLLRKLKKSETFLHHCLAFRSTVFDCRVW